MCKNLVILFLFISCSFVAKTQQPWQKTAPGVYRIEFTDKAYSSYSISKPSEFLSNRALERRKRCNISLKFNDLPVSDFYLDSIDRMGFKVLNVSKWFNAASISVEDTALLHQLKKISFIKQDLYFSNVLKIQQSNSNAIFSLNTTTKDINYYGMAFDQISTVKGEFLHDLGFKGSGMVVAVIDAGFYRVNTLPAFDSLWKNNQIAGFRDFSNSSSGMFLSSTHGMHVLSIMGANIPGLMVGTAPDAVYWLLKSEVTSSEHLSEEDNWVSAAEFADSVGVDVINSSLGYTTFNDFNNNHTYKDLDGNTTRITKAADIAASKGLLVVTSAGNEGNKPWKYISAPADADSALTVGAMLPNGEIAKFSSHGPNYDGKVKPDIVAMGQQVTIQYPDSTFVQGNGTSFSSPVVAGLVACLWQAFPKATNMDIIDALKLSASRYFTPDSLYGYGIANFKAAFALLAYTFQNENAPSFPKNEYKVYPNPFIHSFELQLYNWQFDTARASLYTISGKLVFRKTFRKINSPYEILNIENQSELSSGTYIFKLESEKVTKETKIIKINAE